MPCSIFFDLSRPDIVPASVPRACAIVARWSAKSERMDSPIFSVSSAVCTAPRILSLALFSRSLVAISRERWLSASMRSVGSDDRSSSSRAAFSAFPDVFAALSLARMSAVLFL